LNQTLYILNFHGLGLPPEWVPAGERPFWVEVPFFEAVLDKVRSRKDVRVTFDDSNVSDYTLALPALRKRGMAATFFVVAQRMNQKEFMSRDQIASMVAAGMGIGSHGMSHCSWVGLSDRDLHRELVEARAELEAAAGAPVNEAACPFGLYDRRVLRALRKSGYSRIYTTDEGPAIEDALIQPRYSVQMTHTLSDIERMTNPVPWGYNEMWRRAKIQARQMW
jgi:peptidoglycan/xylan/chitin deacetylase (PgdA/CDA1 family)